MSSSLHRYDNVFWLQIPINNLFSMHIFQCHYNLSDVKVHMIFDHLIEFTHLVIESAAGNVFHLYVHVVFIFQIAEVTHHKWAYISIIGPQRSYFRY